MKNMPRPCWIGLSVEDSTVHRGHREPHIAAAFRSHGVLIGGFGGSTPSHGASPKYPQ